MVVGNIGPIATPVTSTTKNNTITNKVLVSMKVKIQNNKQPKNDTKM